MTKTRKRWVRGAVALLVPIAGILGWDAIRYDVVPKRLVAVAKKKTTNFTNFRGEPGWVMDPLPKGN